MYGIWITKVCKILDVLIVYIEIEFSFFSVGVYLVIDNLLSIDLKI